MPPICWVWILTDSQFSHIAPLNMEIVDGVHEILAACWKDFQSTAGPQGIIFHYWMLDYIFGNRPLIQPEQSLLQSRSKFYFKTHSNFILGERGELSWHEWAFFLLFSCHFGISFCAGANSSHKIALCACVCDKRLSEQAEMWVQFRAKTSTRDALRSA